MIIPPTCSGLTLSTRPLSPQLRPELHAAVVISHLVTLRMWRSMMLIHMSFTRIPRLVPWALPSAPAAPAPAPAPARPRLRQAPPPRLVEAALVPLTTHSVVVRAGLTQPLVSVHILAPWRMPITPNACRGLYSTGLDVEEGRLEADVSNGSTFLLLADLEDP